MLPTLALSSSSSSRRWMFAILLVLVAISFLTRLPSPWRLDVINDEMHHLESWRNRYKSQDIYPLFLQKLELSGRLSPAKLNLLHKFYQSSPLIQRALIVLVDPQPPVYPVLAEITQKMTDSSLVSLRLLSVLFSLLAIWVAYLAGREIRDPMCGLWLASWVCIGAVSQFYAGIGRPYALTQLTILLAIWAFVRWHKKKMSLGSMLGMCLLAQGVQWMAWAVVGPLVAMALVREIRKGWRTLLGKYWWYLATSVLLLLYMLVQMQNPTVANQGGMWSWGWIGWCLAVASPVGHLGSFGDGALYVGASAFALICLAGIAEICRGRNEKGWLYGGILASAMGGLVAAIVAGISVRFAINYITPMLVLAALGMTLLIGQREILGYVVLLLVLGVFGWMALGHPENPYERIDTYDVPWSQVAKVVRQELQPGEPWIAYPPNIANNVYRYAKLPEPMLPANAVEFNQALSNSRDILVLVESTHAEMNMVAGRIRVVINFGNGFVVGWMGHQAENR